MNLIFVFYSLLLIAAIVGVYFAFHLSFFKKILKLKEWSLILGGVVITFVIGFLIITGIKINERVNMELKVPKDFYSNVSYMTDSVITDATLYNHLLLMKANFPKVILCQAKIESNQYSSDLYKRNYNLFGMKASANRVTTAGDSRAGYKQYPNWRESVTDYVLWQLSHNVDKMTQEEYINYLGKIYAEDPNYSNKIRIMIKKIDFKQLEKEEIQ